MKRLVLLLSLAIICTSCTKMDADYAGKKGGVVSTDIDRDDFGAGSNIERIFRVSNEQEWFDAIKTITRIGSSTQRGNNKNYIINLVSNIFIEVGKSIDNDFQYLSGITISIRGNGSISLSGEGNLIRVSSNQNIIIRSMLRGNGDNNTSLIYIDGGNLFVKDGAKIVGNHNNKEYSSSSGIPEGGGVYVINGSFTMSGGEISENIMTAYPYSYGGGVYLENGDCIISGGIIRDNIASEGNWMYLKNSSFTIDNAKINGELSIEGDYNYTGNHIDIKLNSTNTTNETFIALLTDESTITMEDCTIKGVRISGKNSSFTMNSGIIKGNKSNYGVFVNSLFTMNGGEIITDIAGYGYVRVLNGKFVMNGGIIRGDGVQDLSIVEEASNSKFPSSPVEISSGTFIMNGGKIINNTAYAYSKSISQITWARGGGVRNSGVFTMYNGEISGNNIRAGYSESADYDTSHRAFGGGIYNSGTFTMKGGQISGNRAYVEGGYGSAIQIAAGGGVYNDGGQFIMEGGVISDNSTNSTHGKALGGGVYVSDSTFTLVNGTISGNSATAPYYSYGGGVYINYYNYGYFENLGGTVNNNTAQYGDNIYTNFYPEN